MQAVRILTLDEDGDQQEAGRILFDDAAPPGSGSSRVKADPPDSPLLREILTSAVKDRDGLPATRSDGMLWLEALQMHYRSAYLRATAPEDYTPPTKEEYGQAALLAMLDHAGDPEALRAIYRHARDVLKGGEFPTPESLQEGTVTGVDSLGRPYKTVDGKRVKVTADSAEGRAILQRHGKGGGTSSPTPGKGGQKGRKPAEEPQPPTPAQKAAVTKAKRAIGVRVRKSVENEKRLADALSKATGVDHRQLPDNEAVDVQSDGDVEHVTEVKSFWTNSTGQIHMSSYQRQRKDLYAKGILLVPKNTAVRQGITDRAKSYGTDLGRRKYVSVPDPTYRKGVERRKHVVVIDHRSHYAKAKAGKADLDARGLEGNLYYQRSFRAWNVLEMVHCQTADDLGFLMGLSDDDFAGVALEFAGKTYTRAGK